MKNNKVYLEHIIDAINNIEKFIGNMDKGKFIHNTLVNSAVMRQLEIIGEAVKHLPAEFRKKHKDILWKDIAGLRDKLIHDYFGVDVELVWTICKKEIPDFKEKIIKILGAR